MGAKEIVQNFVQLLKDNNIDKYLITFDSGANMHNNDSSKIILKDDAIHCICYNRDHTQPSESLFDYWVGNYDVVNTCAAYGLDFKQGMEVFKTLGIEVDSLSNDDPIKEFILNVPRRRGFIPGKANIGPVTKEIIKDDGTTEVVNTIPKGSSGYVV